VTGLKLERCRLGGAAIHLASARPDDKARRPLARRLLDCLQAASEASRVGYEPRDWAIAHDALGRPALVDEITGVEAPFVVSFSYGPSRTWAALAPGSSVGIDLADDADFAAPYPYDRVFVCTEMALALRLNGGRRQCAAAMLWAIKEASVKSLGCGFSTFDYRDVAIAGRVPGADGLTFVVSAGGRPVTACARREGHGWLALAVAQPVSGVAAGSTGRVSRP
jgi:phosphopantetheinyl transferase (holo-ACP synthase)